MKQKISLFSLLALLSLAGNLAHGQDTNVCYNSSVELSYAPTRTSWTYTWQKKLTTDTTWTTFGSGAMATLASVTESWNVQCLSDSAGRNRSVVYQITVIPYAPLAAAQIATDGNTTICHGTRPSPFSVSTPPSGGGNSYTYQWTRNTLPVTGATGPDFSEQENLFSSTTYQLITNSLCGSASSNEIVITVLPDLDAGTIDTAFTLCHNTPATVSFTLLPSGADGQLSLLWQQSPDAVSWSDVSPAPTGNSYTSPNLSSDLYFRVVVSSPTCNTHDTTNHCVVHVLPPLRPGTIGSDTTVCFNTAPDALSMTSDATGGQSPYSYQWQRSLNGTTFYDIVSATNPENFSPGACTATSFYRLRQTSSMNCGSVFTDTVTIAVYDPLTAAPMPDTLLCHHTTTTLHALPSGGGNSYSYLWQLSPDGNTWSAIPSASDSSYTTALLDDTLFFRVFVSSTISACGQVFSDPVRVAVLPDFLPGAIVRDSIVDTVCYRTSPGTLSMAADASGDMGPGSYSYQWQQSTDSLLFLDIIGANDTVCFMPEIRSKTFFRLQFISAHGCAPVYSAPERFFVYDDDTSAATIFSLAADTVFCFDSIPNSAVEVLSYPTGLLFSHQWQSSTSTEAWHDIPGETSDSIQPGALRQPTTYRLVSTPLNYGHSCPRFSNEVTLNVYPRISAGFNYDTLICHNSSATLFSQPSGGGDVYSYRWEKKITNNEWDSVASDSTYTTAILTNANTSPYIPFPFRVTVTSLKGCSSDTDTITVKVLPQLNPGRLKVDTDSVCYGLKPDYSLLMERNASGGSGSYSYQWWVSAGGASFSHDTAFDNQTEYLLDTLWQTSQYKMRFIDDYGCGTVESTPHTVRVDPLPPTYFINGEPIPCYKQWESYSVPDPSETYSYHWATSNYANRIDSSLSPLNDRVEIYWMTRDTARTILLTTVNRRTRCLQTSSKVVLANDEQAPERTNIVHKANSNILIAEESGDLIYQWGYTDLQTGTQTPIPGANLRYVLLPMDFDSLRYDYWLELRTYEGSPCYSVSHYVGSGNLGIDDLDGVFSASLSVTPLGNKTLAVHFSAPLPPASSLRVYDIQGRLAGEFDIQHSTFSIALPSRGVYILQALLPSGLQISRKAIVY